MLAVSSNRLPIAQPVYSWLPPSISLRGMFCGYLVGVVTSVNAQENDETACLPLSLLTSSSAVVVMGTICFGVGYILARVRLVRHPGRIANV